MRRRHPVIIPIILYKTSLLAPAVWERSALALEGEREDREVEGRMHNADPVRRNPCLWLPDDYQSTEF